MPFKQIRQDKGKKVAGFHLQLDQNEKGRDFFVGDLHGMASALDKALQARDFDPAKDRLISVGDLIDRGPDSLTLLDLLKKPWFFAVRGNHEAMFLDDSPEGRLYHYKAGGKWCQNLNEASLESYRALVAGMPLAISLASPAGLIGVCHSEWPGKDWLKIEQALQNPRLCEQMLWGRTQLRSGKIRRDKTARLTVHGHSPLDAPIRLGSALFIDTGCVYGGALTLLDCQEALDYGLS